MLGFASSCLKRPSLYLHTQALQVQPGNTLEHVLSQAQNATRTTRDNENDQERQMFQGFLFVKGNGARISGVKDR